MRLCFVQCHDVWTAKVDWLVHKNTPTIIAGSRHKVCGAVLSSGTVRCQGESFRVSAAGFNQRSASSDFLYLRRVSCTAEPSHLAPTSKSVEPVSRYADTTNLQLFCFRPRKMLSSNSFISKTTQRALACCWHFMCLTLALVELYH